MEVCVKNLSKVELQVGSFKRSRLTNPLARLIKRKRKQTQIIKIRNEEGASPLTLQ